MSSKKLYLGKLYLGWCPRCNVPLLGNVCSSCGSRAKEVKHTPPGDIRPAFPHDIDLIAEVIERYFSPEAGTLDFLYDRPVVLNPVPAEDKAYEIVVGGQVLAFLSYRLLNGRFRWHILPRISLGGLLGPGASKGRITIDPGAVKSISNGASVLCPGVVDADDMEEGDGVIVMDPEGKVVATGIARMDGKTMRERGKRGERGVGAKNKHSLRSHPGEMIEGVTDDTWAPVWGTVVECNLDYLSSMEGRAVSFIEKQRDKRPNLPMVVSFSGGKDSLACLLLALEKETKPDILFNDTGLEFKETLDYVEDTANKYGLDLIKAEAGSAFWDNLEAFGPPARDYRWCCKVCKLGPIARTINSRFPKGVISLIGQRRYESFSRSKKGKVWRNPWVPSQVGISPIQDWNALAVWLYIFLKKADYNPWYERGLDRIGCYLCPAGDMGDIDIIAEDYPGYGKYGAYLENYVNDRQLPDKWLGLGLWRWKNPPGWSKDLGPVPDPREKKGGLEFVTSEGYAPCTGGYSVEGAFTREINIERAANLLNALDKPDYKEEEGAAELGNEVIVFREGGVIVTGSDENRVKDIITKVETVVRKSEGCVGCGICIPGCPSEALVLENGHIEIIDEKCTHCSECLKGPCPALVYDVGEQ